MNTRAKPGRARRYDLQPVEGSADPFAGYATAAIDELCERLYDLIGDLPQQALDFVPDGATNSIAMLTLHMVWGEASWVARISGTPMPLSFRQALSLGQQGPSGDLPPSSHSAAELVELCRTVRDTYTRPAVGRLENVDALVQDGGRPVTAKGVLMHLIWHWTYHSGQVGLLRRLWGTRYQWTFDHQIGLTDDTN